MGKKFSLALALNNSVTLGSLAARPIVSPSLRSETDLDVLGGGESFFARLFFAEMTRKEVLSFALLQTGTSMNQ